MGSDGASGPALVLGGNGQDGRYLVRDLLARGRRVIAVGTQDGSVEPECEAFRYLCLDLRNRDRLSALLREHAPAEVYHFAAVHKSAAGAPYEGRFGDMLDVNVASVHVVLEQLRSSGGRMIYASSIKAFGEPAPEVIEESTARRSHCLYAVTKNAATDLIHHYRRRHDVHASVVWLANHESPLRPVEFFIPKLARCLAGAKENPDRGPTAFYTLDFHCDWGSAEEFMAIVVDMLGRAPTEDYVLGTGRTVRARALATQLFADGGLEMARYIQETKPPARGEASASTVRIDKLKRLLGRCPTRSIEDVVAELVTNLEHATAPGNEPPGHTAS